MRLHVPQGIINHNIEYPRHVKLRTEKNFDWTTCLSTCGEQWLEIRQLKSFVS